MMLYMFLLLIYQTMLGVNIHKADRLAASVDFERD